MKNVAPKLSPAVHCEGCILSGFDHGPITWKFTGLPRQDAASIRSGTSGACAYEPVHAARASKLTNGIQCGSAGAKRVMSRPAAVNNAVQSAGRCGTGVSSTCGGTALNSISRPCAIQIQTDHSRRESAADCWGKPRKLRVDGSSIWGRLEVLRALAIPEIDQGRLPFRQLRLISGGLLLLLRVALVLCGVKKTVRAVDGRLRCIRDSGSRPAPSAPEPPAASGTESS